VAGGAAEVLPAVPLTSCPLPLLRTHPSSLLVCCFLVFVEMRLANATIQHMDGWEVNLFLYEKRGGKSHFDIGNPSFSCIGNLKILHSQPFAATYIHADKQDPRETVSLMHGFEDRAACQVVAVSLSDFILFACVGIQKGYAGHCLVEGRGGKFSLLSA